MLKFVDVKIKRSHAPLIDNFAIGRDDIKPIRPGLILVLGVVIHPIQQHWEREVVPQHAGCRDFRPLILGFRLFEYDVFVQVPGDLVFSLGMGFTDVNTVKLDLVTE